MKRCSKCGALLPESQFNKIRSYNPKLRSQCKSCEYQYFVAYRKRLKLNDILSILACHKGKQYTPKPEPVIPKIVLYPEDNDSVYHFKCDIPLPIKKVEMVNLDERRDFYSLAFRTSHI